MRRSREKKPIMINMQCRFMHWLLMERVSYTSRIRRKLRERRRRGTHSEAD